MTASLSRGLTQYMSSTVADTPCSASRFPASMAGRTISPQAMMATSEPSRSTVALSMTKGTLSSA